MINKALLVCILLFSGVVESVTEFTVKELLDQVKNHIHAGEENKAALQLKELLAKEPGNISARFLQARLYSIKGETENAIAGYESLIKDHPELPEAYNNLAALFVRKNNLKQARLILEQGIKTHAAYASIYRNISAVYVEMARKSYTEARLLKQEMRPLELQQLSDLVEINSVQESASSE